MWGLQVDRWPYTMQFSVADCNQFQKEKTMSRTYRKPVPARSESALGLAVKASVRTAKAAHKARKEFNAYVARKMLHEDLLA